MHPIFATTAANLTTGFTPSGAYASAHQGIAGQITGHATGPASGPASFSLDPGNLPGKVFSMGSKTWSLKPDFIPASGMSQSYGVFQGFNKVGTIGQLFGSSGLGASPQLGPQLGTALGSALRQAGLL